MKKTIKIAILATNFAGNKGAAAMLKSAIKNINQAFAHKFITYNLMSVYPDEDRHQNPYYNLKVVSCKPEHLIFIAFPLSIIYYLFKWIPPVRSLLLKNKILKGFYESDLVLDQAGVTFVDSRGFVMNTYNFICMATPLLLGKKVMKYSQAMGPFSGWNRFVAKLVMPKLQAICARGEITQKHLHDLGLTNVSLCADGAFTMFDDESARINVEKIIKDDHLYDKPVVSLSISSVVEGYCDKGGIDYKKITAQFIDYLIKDKGYGVLIIANAARKGKTSRKNNDLVVCQAIYDMVEKKEMCRWYDDEFTPEEIREFISLTKMMVASRFHAMIGALYKEVPVLLIGWSHKYQEVLDMFSLGQNAIDYKKLDLQDLIDEFERFENEEEMMKGKIRQHLPKVKQLSMRNIEVMKQVLAENQD